MTSENHSSSRKEMYKFPYEIVDVNEGLFEKIRAQLYGMVDRNSVLVGPQKYFLPEMYKHCYSDIYNFKARPDDILLIGFPRSGTTLHSEMVWQIENNLDFETVKDVILIHRFPVIDLCLSMGDLNVMSIIADNAKVSDDVRNIAKRYTTVTIDNLASCKDRRFLRSHLPVSLLSPSFFETGCKVIYCARNPKDLVVSYYHVSQFMKPKESESVSFESFWRAFKNNWTMYSPYFAHLKEAWKKKGDDNFLFLFYEDTAKDLRQAVVKVADFLKRDLSHDQLDELVDYLSIEKFKKNKSVNCEHVRELGIASNDVKFIRSGKNGGWRKYFVGNLEMEADDWIRENLKDADIVFPED